MPIETFRYGHNVRLSPHFSSDEFASKDGKTVYSPTIRIDRAIVELLEKVHTHFDCKAIYINSGYRTHAHDIAVGGNGKGRHTLGMAADFKCKRKDGTFVPSEDICVFLETSGVFGIGRINARSVHADTRPSHQKWFGDEETGKTYTTFIKDAKKPKDTASILSKEYFPPCAKNEISIVNALKSIGEQSAFAYRKRIADQNGISPYSGTALQNRSLLQKLKAGTLLKPQE